MKFNQLVLDQLGSLFKKHNLKIAEQSENRLKFSSRHLDVVIVHNERENSNTLWLGRAGDSFDKIEIDNYVMKEFFRSDVQVSSVPTEVFVQNLATFFENNFSVLNEVMLIELEKFGQQRSEVYTDELMYKQNLEVADKAWRENDYRGFINYLDKIGKEKLPSSYELKYKMALQKLK